MLYIRRGRVKFFRAEKGWGFITPDDGSGEVYFHADYYSGLSEFYDGELELEFDHFATLADVYRTPKSGEEILYDVFRTEKGLMAIHWLFPEAFLKAEQVLSTRQGSPSNFDVRVTRYGPEEMQSRAPHGTLIWEGTHDEYSKKLDEGFPEMFNHDFSVEKLEINGKWERMWHPSNWHEKYKKPDPADALELEHDFVVSGQMLLGRDQENADQTARQWMKEARE